MVLHRPIEFTALTGQVKFGLRALLWVGNSRGARWRELPKESCRGVRLNHERTTPNNRAHVSAH